MKRENDGSRLLLCWFVFLLALAWALLSRGAWGEEAAGGISPMPAGSTAGPASSMNIESPSLTEIWLLLRPELAAWQRDWEESETLWKEAESKRQGLEKRLEEASLLVCEVQAENSELRSSLGQWITLWESTKEAERMKDEASREETRAALDRAIAAERKAKVLGGVAIGAGTAGVIGWALYLIFGVSR